MACSRVVTGASVPFAGALPDRLYHLVPPATWREWVVLCETGRVTLVEPNQWRPVGKFRPATLKEIMVHYVSGKCAPFSGQKRADVAAEAAKEFAAINPEVHHVS